MNLQTGKRLENVQKKTIKVNCENSLTEKWIDANQQTGIKGNDQTVKWMDLKINKGENSENR